MWSLTLEVVLGWEVLVTRVWICPRCGRETARSEGQTSRKCTCGSIMDAAVKKGDSKCILERLED